MSHFKLIEAVTISPADLKTIAAVRNEIDAIDLLVHRSSPTPWTLTGERSWLHDQRDAALAKLAASPTQENMDAARAAIMLDDSSKAMKPEIHRCLAEARAAKSAELTEIVSGMFDRATADLEARTSAAIKAAAKTDDVLTHDAAGQIQSKANSIKAALAAEREIAMTDCHGFLQRNNLAQD